MAPIAAGDTLPEGSLNWFDESDQMQTLSIHSLAAGKKVILIGLPGAFTPTCSTKHVPGFIEQAEELKAKGVDEILVISGYSGLDLDTPVPRSNSVKQPFMVLYLKT